TDSTAPYLLWSWYPVVNGVHPNRPQNGYAFVWNDGLIIRFYKSSDLKWEGGDQSDTTYWLAKGIMSEASIGVQQEQIAVGWCVLNRLHNESFGETMEAVVKNGFAWNQEPTQQIKNLANDLLEGIQPDPTDGALYFFSPRSMPKDGENTQGYDVEGRIHIIPGTSYKVYFPSWAEPTKEIDENTKSYQTTSDMEWTELNDIRNWYFMFYHPYSSQISSHVDEPNQRRNIMLTGFWNPTGQMIAQFSTDPSLNPGGWKGENWENLGYTIYSYFPTSGTYTGVFQVDYQATLEDFQNITDKIKPVAIISFGAGDKGYSWTIEHNARNLNIWEDDEKAPTQPTPCPPDSSQNVGYVRHSTLPVQAIENAVKTQTSVEAWVDWDGNPGAYLCEYMAYLGMQYQALHNTSNDPYQCLAAGFIHVKPDLKLEDAMMATNVTIREVVKYLQNTPSDHTGNKQPGFEIIIIIGAIALVLFWKRKRRDGD
ncbi:MAG: cell wall hydrolase, partial [Euryarchaeota archaeon]|nr:cell wall hydrolase [Euryarchaeota archaeon]